MGGILMVFGDLIVGLFMVVVLVKSIVYYWRRCLIEWGGGRVCRDDEY